LIGIKNQTVFGQNQKMPVRALRPVLVGKKQTSLIVSESKNARQGIKTIAGTPGGAGLDTSESKNARQGIKTVPGAISSKSGSERQNQKMPVRALRLIRPPLGFLAGHKSQNQKMPVRALRQVQNTRHKTPCQ